MALGTLNKVLVGLVAFTAALFIVAWFYFSATPDQAAIITPTVSKTSDLSPTPLLTRFTDKDDSILIKNVPFTAQASTGKWSDSRQQDGCEEASVLMAIKWLRGETLTPQSAEQEIIKIADYELEKFGSYHDTSPTDTVERIIKGYFGYQNAEAFENIRLVDIKNELRKGNLVLVQLDGQAIKNPNYRAPGPERHMLVIVGYDAEKQEFITNDSGTRKGEGYVYAEYRLWQSIRDYPTGDHLPITEITKSMIVVRPS